MKLFKRIFWKYLIQPSLFLTSVFTFIWIDFGNFSNLEHFLCGSKTKAKGFKVLESYQKKITPGQKGLPSSDEYFFKILVNHDELRFDSLWTNSTVLATHVARDKGAITNNPMTYGKGDTITVRASHLLKKEDIKLTAFPVKTDGQAVLGYFYQNKRKFLVLKSIPKN